MYKARKKKGWSQTMLAKEMYTTEEIIDNIENSNGLNLQKRIKLG